MKPVLLVVGTRPEGIKMMPVYLALKKQGIPTVLCSTTQHDELLAEVFQVFQVTPDYELKIMRSGQDLSYITTAVLDALKQVYTVVNPSVVLVQGDTTTVMAASLAAFYQKIPVGHIEAGLRTGDRYSPYPEELNREIVGLTASYHFAPTSTAVGNLLAEGKPRHTVFCTGNTVVDALRYVQEKLSQETLVPFPALQHAVQEATLKGQVKVLVTAHRRESFDGGIHRILHTIKRVALERPDIMFFYPSHPNPAIQNVITDVGLQAIPNIMLTQPLTYKDLVYVLLAVDMVATDSGGIQEEAISLGKPVAVLREKTERMEGVWEGLAMLAGTDETALYEVLMMCQSLHKQSAKKIIYGDGYAAEKIVRILQQQCALGALAYQPVIYERETQRS